MDSPGCSAPVGGEPVTGAPDGLDRVPGEGLVDPAPQPLDVDLDDVGVALERVVPHSLENGPLAHDLAGPTEEELEDVELPCRQLDLGVASPGAPLGGIDAKVTGGDRVSDLVRRRAEEGLEPGLRAQRTRTAW